MKRISALIFGTCVLLYQALGLAQNKFLLGYSSFSSNQTPLWVAKIKPDMVINHSILKKLDDSGFIDQLAKR